VPFFKFLAQQQHEFPALIMSQNEKMVGKGEFIILKKTDDSTVITSTKSSITVQISELCFSYDLPNSLS